MRARRFASIAVIALAVWGGMTLWSGWRAQQLGDRVAAAARPGDIVMVSSLDCPYCKQAREWFGNHRVAFSECFVERDRACAATYEALLAPGTPVLVVRGRRLVGFDAERIAAALAG